MCMHVYAARACVHGERALRQVMHGAREGCKWRRVGNRDGRGSLVLLATCPFLTHDIASDFRGRVVIRRKPPLKSLIKKKEKGGGEGVEENLEQSAHGMILEISPIIILAVKR